MQLTSEDRFYIPKKFFIRNITGQTQKPSHIHIRKTRVDEQQYHWKFGCPITKNVIENERKEKMKTKSPYKIH